MAGEPLVKEIFIDATPEEIFPYLTRSEKWALWMGISAEIDPHPGGIFKVNLNTVDVVDGKFLELAPPSRAVFTWGFQAPVGPVTAGSTRVEIELRPQDGGTLLRLTHHGLPGERRVRFDSGWSHYLSRLKIVLAGCDPGRDNFGESRARLG